jgi:Golgi phosphoprotein 3
MLSFAEEIYLLALDDVTGKLLIPSKEVVLNTALLGATLAELAFLRKIDTDTENLFVLDTELTDSPVLNLILDVFRQTNKTQMQLCRYIEVLLPKSKEIEQLVLKELISKAILKQVNEKIFWIFPSHRYPIINNQEISSVETRLRQILLSDEIPEPREATLISLVNACGLFSEILSARELRRAEAKIEALSKFDMVGQKINELIRQINDFSTLPPFI